MSQIQKTFVKNLKPKFRVIGIFCKKTKDRWWNTTEYYLDPFSREELEEEHYPTSMIDKILSDNFKGITHSEYYEQGDDDAYCISTSTEEIEIFQKTHPNYKIISQKIIDEKTSAEHIEIEYVKECPTK